MKKLKLVSLIKESGGFDDVYDGWERGFLDVDSNSPEKIKKDQAKRVVKWISDNPSWKEDKVKIQKWINSWPEEAIFYYVLELIESGEFESFRSTLEYNSFLNSFLKFEDEHGKVFVGHEDFDEDIARMADQGKVDKDIFSKIPDSAFERMAGPSEEMPLKKMSMAKWYIDQAKKRGIGYPTPKGAIKKKK